MGMAEMLGSNIFPLGLDVDLNFEESTGRDSTSDPVRFFILSGRQQTASEEETSHTSEADATGNSPRSND